MQFKEGDRVKVKRPCSGCFPEEIYILCPRGKDSVYLRAYNSKLGKGCSCENNWIKVNDLNVRELNKSIIKTPKIKKAEVVAQKIVEAKPKI